MKANKLFVLMPTVLLGMGALTGCGEQKPELKVINADSELVMTWADAGHFKMPTYGLTTLPELPYVKVSESATTLANAGMGKLALTRDDKGVYTLADTSNATRFVLKADVANNTLTLGETYLALGASLVENRGIGPDYGAPADRLESLVHTSEKTRVIGEAKADVVKLGDYGITLFEKDNELYMPSPLFLNIVTRGIGTDFAYNGRDYYMTNSVGAMIGNMGSFLSAEGSFTLNDGVDSKQSIYKKVNVRASRPDGKKEAYRFVCAGVNLDPDPQARRQGYVFMTLFEDGTGVRTFSMSENPEEEVNDVMPGLMGYSVAYEWKKAPEALDVVRYIIQNDEMGTERKVDINFRINLGKGWFNTKTRPSSIIDFNYGLLRYQIDRDYGLRNVKKIGDAEKYFNTLGVTAGLKSANSLEYDRALAKLLLAGCDDGHTLYTGTSIFTGVDHKAMDLAREAMGPRYRKLVENLNRYDALRDEYFKSLGTPEETNKYFDVYAGKPLQKGLFTHESTAIIRFDQFLYPGKTNYLARVGEVGQPLEFTSEPFSFANSDTMMTFMVSFKKLETKPEVKDIVIDLTNNGGGMIMTMPWIMAYISDDPMYVVNDDTKDVVKEFHYKVDLNNDGKYGDVGDTFKGKYNFYILTSECSFSCGNALPSLAKQAGAKIIGKRSGGGSSSVATYSDACGSIYNLSSIYEMQRYEGDKWINNDDGVPLDKEWEPSADWYNPVKVHEFIQTLK